MKYMTGDAIALQYIKSRGCRNGRRIETNLNEEIRHNKKLSIEALVEQIKYQVRSFQNYESEYRQNNKNNYTFRNFQPIMKDLMLVQK